MRFYLLKFLEFKRGSVFGFRSCTWHYCTEEISSLLFLVVGNAKDGQGDGNLLSAETFNSNGLGNLDKVGV